MMSAAPKSRAGSSAHGVERFSADAGGRGNLPDCFRPGTDGGVAGLAHRPGVFRRRLPDHDLRGHRRGIVRDDPVALGLAGRWAKVSAVLFAIGAVSGTVLSFEMGLLWPGLMGRFGDVLGLPFAFEGLSFFVEAIFLGIYLYGWDRLPPRRTWHADPMGRPGIVGTFCVVSVNAWMNNPTGFRDPATAGCRRQPVAGDVQRRGVAAVPAHVGRPRSWSSGWWCQGFMPPDCCGARDDSSPSRFHRSPFVVRHRGGDRAAGHRARAWHADGHAAAGQARGVRARRDHRGTGSPFGSVGF